MFKCYTAGVGVTNMSKELDKLALNSHHFYYSRMQSKVQSGQFVHILSSCGQSLYQFIRTNTLQFTVCAIQHC
jgi:hypothetical protein